MGSLSIVLRIGPQDKELTREMLGMTSLFLTLFFSCQTSPINSFAAYFFPFGKMDENILPWGMGQYTLQMNEY